MPLDIYAIHNVRPPTTTGDLESFMEVFHFGGEWADREEGAPEGRIDGDVIAHDRIGYVEYRHHREMLSMELFGIRWDPENLPSEVPAGVADHPIWKLINYADYRGVFGPEMCKRIADAFDDAKQRPLLGMSWWWTFFPWFKVFRAAADAGGIVVYA